MEIYISINGVLRNLIQKFDYHFKTYLVESESTEDNPFEYKINYPIQNDDIQKYFVFQNKEEFEYFTFIEYPLEIFGHAGLSYSTSISDLNKLIYNNPNVNFTVIGLDELGKSKSSTLFFLSKNGFLGNNIKFIRSSNINDEWKKCDMWITDNEEIINKCPKKKLVIKFNTDYNQYFKNKIEINSLNKIDEVCLKSWENITQSTLTKLLKNVVRNIKIRK